jgi:hypothetical protein
MNSDEQKELETLLAEARDLEREIAPARDLWPEIEGRIAISGGRVVRGPWRSSAWLGWAAAAVLVVVLGLRMGRDQESMTPGSLASSPDRDEISLVAQISDAARARDGLGQVRTDLLRSIIERRDSLDAEARRTVDENLLVIDRAIADIHYALQEDPENRRLEFLLASTYQREVDFLKQINLL